MKWRVGIARVQSLILNLLPSCHILLQSWSIPILPSSCMVQLMPLAHFQCSTRLLEV